MKVRISAFALTAVMTLGAALPFPLPAQDTEQTAQGMITVLRDTSMAVQVDGTREVVFRVEPGITEKVGRVAVGSMVNVYYHRNEKGQRFVTRVEAVSLEG